MAWNRGYQNVEPDSEIWSEYARIKHQLMDYDQNLRESIANMRILSRLGIGGSRMNVHYAKAQKHVAMILDLGMSCGAIPDEENEEFSFVEAVSKGHWRSVEDFERCQEFFRKGYIRTKFYNVLKEIPRQRAPHEMI